MRPGREVANGSAESDALGRPDQQLKGGPVLLRHKR